MCNVSLQSAGRRRSWEYSIWYLVDNTRRGARVRGNISVVRNWQKQLRGYRLQYINISLQVPFIRQIAQPWNSFRMPRSRLQILNFVLNCCGASLTRCGRTVFIYSWKSSRSLSPHSYSMHNWIIRWQKFEVYEAIKSNRDNWNNVGETAIRHLFYSRGERLLRTIFQRTAAFIVPIHASLLKRGIIVINLRCDGIYRGSTRRPISRMNS